jgi:hypothetical protein
MFQSGRMSQVHNHVVVFMSCSNQAEWVKFMNRRLYNCHAGVRQDESSSWPGSCIHVMLESGRMSQVLGPGSCIYVMLESGKMSNVLDQEDVFMSCSSQTGWVKFMTSKLYSCQSWVGRMNKVLDQVVVLMQCSSQAVWVKFMNRKLYSCHAPDRQDESSWWPGNCIHVMLESDRMGQVHDQKVVFISFLSQVGWIKLLTR